MEFLKIVNLFDTTFDDQNFLLKNGLKLIVNQKKNTMLTKKLELKQQF